MIRQLRYEDLVRPPAYEVKLRWLTKLLEDLVANAPAELAALGEPKVMLSFALLAWALDRDDRIPRERRQQWIDETRELLLDFEVIPPGAGPDIDP